MSAISSCSSSPASLLLRANQQSPVSETATATAAGDADAFGGTVASGAASRTAPVNGSNANDGEIDNSMLAKLRAAINAALQAPHSGGSGFSWFSQLQAAIKEAVQTANHADHSPVLRPLPAPHPAPRQPDPDEPATPRAPPVAQAASAAAAPAPIAATVVPQASHVQPAPLAVTPGVDTAVAVAATPTAPVRAPANSADPAQRSPDRSSPANVIASWAANPANASINSNLLLNQPLYGGKSPITLASLLRGLFVDASA